VLKNLTESQYLRVSQLLDESLELTPAERERWLATLSTSDPETAAVLRDLFASQDASNAEGFLADQGQLARELGSVTQSVTGMVGKQFGAYRVLSLIGHGGMGSVWLAERTDGLFTRRVALKLVHPALIDRVMTERLGREREILASLSHPNIARLFDAGFAEDGQPYLALEYVAGTPLTTFCDDRRLPIPARLDLFRQVLDAVQYAHANLVIHRDIKPSNILVNEEGHAHLLDFGIAKLLTEGGAKETELTRVGGRALTPDYAAPEQISGGAITTSTDIYALGVMLYEILTGERPYRLKRESRGALEEAILGVDPMPPSRTTLKAPVAQTRSTTPVKLAKLLKGDLDTIVLKALKKLPGERYATANAFDEDIHRFLRGDLVLAQPDSFAYRARKFASRHRVALGAAGMLLLTLAGGLTATTYEAGLAQKQRDAALDAHFRLLTQTAEERVKQSDASDGMGIILEVLGRGGSAKTRTYSPDALSVFQEARSADAEILVISGHTERIRSAQFSPDGKRIITASYDRTARIWDSSTGREIMQLSGHTDRLRSASYSLDGRHIVTSSHDKTARIWDAATGQQLMVLTGHTDAVRSAEFSADGSRVVTGSYDQTARVWDVATGKQLQVLSGHTSPVVWASFAPDGQRILTASQDRTARIWDVQSGKQLVLLNGHTGQLTSGAFSPDGRHVVTASFDKTARIWDAATGQQLSQLSGHTQLLEHVEFSRDGSRVVTVSDDKTARVWDADTGRQLALFIAHTEPLTGAAFSPDGRYIVTCSDDMTARVWNTLGPEGLVLRGHTQVVAGAEFSPDGRRVATASADKTARIWDATTGQQLTLLSGHTQLVLSAIFSADGRRVITASDDSTARIWDSTTRRQLLLLSGHTQAVEGAAFTPDGKRIVTASSDKTVRLWDASTGHQLMELDGHTAKVNWAMFSPDGRRIATASYDKTARVWDASNGRQLMVFNGHSGPVATASFSPDGDRIVTASDDKTARVWDVATGRQLVLLSGHEQPVTSAAFSADGRRVVTSSYDKTARIWDAATGQQLMAVVLPDLVETAAFSPDGQRIVTASDDKTAGIWNVRAPPLEQQIEWAEAAQFESLSSTERFQLGLPDPAAVRAWSRRLKCDEAAGAPYDPDRRAQGVVLDRIVTEIALQACPPSTYQHGRALWRSGNIPGAQHDFEQAAKAGYRAANVDLAMLLSAPTAGMLDAPQAISLYERAWKDGVSIAGFELGSLYEHGIRDEHGAEVLARDETRAWFWYQEAADAGEPHALARFGERYDDAALAADSETNRDAALLTSFARYAAAAERARREDWPDETWRNWRYRRASLARVLARDGMMYDVAKTYESVR
jgi:WD40 repeat protein/serine/threonine protein kinase/TPR repeat protein